MLALHKKCPGIRCSCGILFCSYGLLFYRTQTHLVSDIGWQLFLTLSANILQCPPGRYEASWKEADQVEEQEAGDG